LDEFNINLNSHFSRLLYSSFVVGRNDSHLGD
jgi:hypothetical protein